MIIVIIICCYVRATATATAIATTTALMLPDANAAIIFSIIVINSINIKSFLLFKIPNSWHTFADCIFVSKFQFFAQFAFCAP